MKQAKTQLISIDIVQVLILKTNSSIAIYDDLQFILTKFLFLLGLIYIKDLTDDKLEMPFSIPSSSGQEVQLSSKHSKITPANKLEYIKQAINYRYSIVLWMIDRKI